MVVFDQRGPDISEELNGLRGLQLFESAPGSDEVTAILGNPMDTRVFTGQSTKVEKKHIEYDINTFSGCSGAAVFLLDEGSVNHCKVIAVHAGFEVALKTSIGFKLAGCPG